MLWLVRLGIIPNNVSQKEGRLFLLTGKDCILFHSFSLGLKSVLLTLVPFVQGTSFRVPSRMGLAVLEVSTLELRDRFNRTNERPI